MQIDFRCWRQSLAAMSFGVQYLNLALNDDALSNE